MKNTQFARFLTVLAVALVFSSCADPNEPFFRYNSPFGDKNKPSAEGGFGIQPASFFDTGDVGDPAQRNLSANAEQKKNEPGAIKSPGAAPGVASGAAPGVAPEADTQAAPEIFVHKPGPAGSMCYTCRGKGYVLQTTTDSAGDIYKCPACGGDGRN